MAVTFVQSRAEEALRGSAHPALRRLSVKETDSAIIISGEVSSYFLKQMAQETIKPYSGPLELVNRVVVESF